MERSKQERERSTVVYSVRSTYVAVHTNDNNNNNNIILIPGKYSREQLLRMDGIIYPSLNSTVIIGFSLFPDGNDT